LPLKILNQACLDPELTSNGPLGWMPVWGLRVSMFHVYVPDLESPNGIISPSLSEVNKKFPGLKKEDTFIRPEWYFKVEF
jgi:hypothetical protein